MGAALSLRDTFLIEGLRDRVYLAFLPPGALVKLIEAATSSSAWAMFGRCSYPPRDHKGNDLREEHTDERVGSALFSSGPVQI